MRRNKLILFAKPPSQVYYSEQAYLNQGTNFIGFSQEQPTLSLVISSKLDFIKI